MHLATVFLWDPHFYEFFFAPPGKPAWEGAVWGNVVAVVPLAILAVFGYLWHRGVLREAHEKLDALAAAHDEHAAKLNKLLDALDPDEDTDSQLDRISESLDLDTPGGLTRHRDEILAAIEATPPINRPPK